MNKRREKREGARNLHLFNSISGLTHTAHVNVCKSQTCWPTAWINGHVKLTCAFSNKSDMDKF